MYIKEFELNKIIKSWRDLINRITILLWYECSHFLYFFHLCL